MMSVLFSLTRQYQLILLVGCTFLFTIFSGAPAVYGGDGQRQSVATAVAVRGQVVVRSGKGDERKLAVKEKLYLDDTIKTGARGRLQILFDDNTIYSLGSNTELKLKGFAWDPQKKEGKLATEVKDGVFRVMGGLISKTNPQKFTAETPVATIGIRGSMYTSSYTPAAGLSVIFEGGKGITVSNATGMVVISEPGFGSQVSDWQSPVSKPRQMSEQDAGRLYEGFKVSRKGKAVPRVERKMERLPPPVFSAKELAGPTAAGIKGKGDNQALAGLTAAVEAKPEQAAEVLRDAIRNDDVPVDEALGAVLKGMVNTDRQQFEAVIKEAVGYGLTADKAREIVERLKESGGVCP